VSGDGRHFDAVVVSDEFLNKSRIARHRLVYDALGEKNERRGTCLVIKIIYVFRVGAKING
jgi:acid stress-induced BolA-like protein IbaG/YrbA